jgi:hypothetical protein
MRILCYWTGTGGRSGGCGGACRVGARVYAGGGGGCGCEPCGASWVGRGSVSRTSFNSSVGWPMSLCACTRLALEASPLSANGSVPVPVLAGEAAIFVSGLDVKRE